MSQTQLLAVLQPGRLAEYADTAHPYAAFLIADTALIASYGFLLSRLMSWAFAHRVGFTSIGLNDKLANLAGRLLPLLIAADLLENMTTLVAMHHDNFLLESCSEPAGGKQICLVCRDRSSRFRAAFFETPVGAPLAAPS